MSCIATYNQWFASLPARPASYFLAYRWRNVVQLVETNEVSNLDLLIASRLLHVESMSYKSRLKLRHFRKRAEAFGAEPFSWLVLKLFCWQSAYDSLTLASTALGKAVLCVTAVSDGGHSN